MKYYIQLIVVGMIFLVSACGDDSFTTSDPNSNEKFMVLQSYQVNNTDFTSSALEKLIIDTPFNVSWLLFSTDPYHVELWLSNTVIINDAAVNFYSLSCGADFALYPLCNNGVEANISCSYSIDNAGQTILSCSKAAGQIITNLTEQDAYLILRACDDSKTTCRNPYVTVNLALN